MLETFDSRVPVEGRYHPRSGVRAAPQADRVLLVDPSRGRYYVLRGVAREIWPLLALDLTIADIARRLEAPGVVRLVGAMLAAGLVEPASSVGVPAAVDEGRCCG